VRSRLILTIMALAAASLALASLGTGAASASTTCTWAGTPVEPTGTFTLTPGVTDVPSAGPLKFKATGALGGECAGTMTFNGQFDAGSSCAFIEYEGAVKGLRGVARFWGKGGLLAPSLLYDSTGHVVGSETAQIMTEANRPHTATDCSTQEGFTGGWPGMFSSVIELF
jgi:hypothetical protein